MKILGRVDSNNCLLQASNDELARICGDSYHTTQRFEVGTEVRVHDLWNGLSAIRQKDSTVKGLAKNLRTLADDLEKVSQALKNPIVEVVKS